MKIISKFKDYYDGGQALGIDKTLVFNRFVEVFGIETLTGFEKLDRSAWEVLPEAMHIVLDDRSVYDSRYRITLEYSAIGFCGRLYPFVSFVTQQEGQDRQRNTFYQSKSFTKHLEKLLVKFPKSRFVNEFYQCEPPTSREISNYLSHPVFQQDYVSWFQQLKAPIFLFTDDLSDYTEAKEDKVVINKSNLVYVVTNPVLKALEFYKVLDTYSCFQELSQFLSGVLTFREDIKDNLSDKDKIRQHGFDLKYGFRKRPEK